MRWQSIHNLMIALSLVNVELSESAYLCAGSIARRTTWIWSKEVPSDDNFLAPESVLSTESSRKQRRNKYKDFSKVTDRDPLEVLISESKRKNDEIIAGVTSSARSLASDVVAIPYVQYPDVKTIDPYDPQTFGYTFIGTIVGAHGVHGWLKVQCSTDFPNERLCTPGVRHLKAVDKRAPRPIVLVNGKHRQGDEYLIQFENVDCRETALKMRGAQLYIRDEEKRGALDSDDYSVSDLIGLEVFLWCEGNREDARFVGQVSGVVFSEDMCSIPGLGHDYLEVVLPRGIGGTKSLLDEMVLVPFVPALVPEVDVEKQKIYVDPPAGLLDLTYVREEKARIKGFLPPASISNDRISDEPERRMEF